MEIVPIAIAAGGAAGEDDIDKHGSNPFIEVKNYPASKGPDVEGFMREYLKGYGPHNVHFVRPVNGH